MYAKFWSVLPELACVNVADPLTLAETNKLFSAVLPFAVIGIKTITLSPPILASVKVVVV